jgi:hypothetical protein
MRQGTKVVVCTGTDTSYTGTLVRLKRLGSVMHEISICDILPGVMHKCGPKRFVLN